MIQINKRNIGTSILLSIVTFGIYFIYWEYLLVKNTRAIKKDNSSCTGEMLCLIFVPIYSIYWWFTRGKLVKDEFASHGYIATGNEIAYLVLGIFGLEIVSMAIMQNDYNSLPSEVADVSTQTNQRSADKDEIAAVSGQLDAAAKGIKDMQAEYQRYIDSTKIYHDAVKYLAQAANYARFGELDSLYQSVES